MVALDQSLDARPDLGDDAGTLVAADDRVKGVDPEHRDYLRRGCHIAGAQMLIGVTHARIRHLNPHLVRTRGVDLDLFDFPGFVESCTDCCAGLHVSGLLLLVALTAWVRRQLRADPAVASSQDPDDDDCGSPVTHSLSGFSSNPEAKSRNARSTSPVRSSLSWRAQQANAAIAAPRAARATVCGPRLSGDPPTRRATKSATTSHHSAYLTAEWATRAGELD